MKTHILLRKPQSRVIQLHSDRQQAAGQHSSRSQQKQHRRSNSSQSLSSIEACQAEIRQFLQPDAYKVKDIRTQTKEIRDICRKQHFIVQTRMFNPRQYFGAANIEQNTNLYLFQPYSRLKHDSNLSRPPSTVKFQKKKPEPLQSRTLADNSSKKECVSRSQSKDSNSLDRIFRPFRKHKQNLDPNSIIVSRTDGTQQNLTLKIKSVKTRGQNGRNHN